MEMNLDYPKRKLTLKDVVVAKGDALDAQAIGNLTEWVIESNVYSIKVNGLQWELLMDIDLSSLVPATIWNFGGSLFEFDTDIKKSVVIEYVNSCVEQGKWEDAVNQIIDNLKKSTAALINGGPHDL
jgi:hypothetical protein